MGNPSGALENFLSRLGNSLDSYGMDAIIHFRGCNQGAEDENGNRTFLQQLAMYTNRRVTACAGAPASQLPHNPITGEAYDPSTWEGEGPDYRFTGSVFMSDPAGNVSVYWRLTVTSDWLGRPVLDYHDQPY